MPEWTTFLGKEGVLEQQPSEESVSRRSMPHGFAQQLYSKDGLQWLPAEFHVSKDGQTCTINSYINSLHPIQHSALYESIGELFCHALPVLEEVLAEAGDNSGGPGECV